MARGKYVRKGGGVGPHKCRGCGRRFKQPVNGTCSVCKVSEKKAGYLYSGGDEHVSPMPAEFAMYHEARIVAEEQRVAADLARLGIT